MARWVNIASPIDMSSSGGVSIQVISMRQLLRWLGSEDGCCPLTQGNGTDGGADCEWKHPPAAGRGMVPGDARCRLRRRQAASPPVAKRSSFSTAGERSELS